MSVRGACRQAIDFAKEQNDEELWEDLISYSMTRPGAALLIRRGGGWKRQTA